MHKINSIKYFRILSFILVITTYLPVLSKNLPPFIRSHHLWAIIWIFSLIYLKPEVFKNRIFVYVLVYQIFFLLFIRADFWIGIDEWTISALGYEVYYFIVALSLITYYRFSKDYHGLASVIKWSMIFIGVTAIMSIYSSLIDPLYAREITAGNLEAIESLNKYGGGTYGYAAALICLFPVMFYYYRNNSISIFSRTQILIFGIICFLALLRMQFFGNIILSVFVLIFSLFGRKDLKKSIFIFVLSVIIIIAIPERYKANFMMQLSGLFVTESVNKEKISDLTDYMYFEDEKTMTGSRIARYPLLWEAFKNHPFNGHFIEESDYKIGEGAHIYFMYRLTAFGILNFIMFIIIFINHIKSNIKIFSERFSFYFLLSALSILVLGLMKNLAGRELWYMYFFIIPGLYYLPILKMKKSNNQTHPVFTSEANRNLYLK